MKILGRKSTEEMVQIIVFSRRCRPGWYYGLLLEKTETISALLENPLTVYRRLRIHSSLLATAAFCVQGCLALR